MKNVSSSRPRYLAQRAIIAKARSKVSEQEFAPIKEALARARAESLNFRSQNKADDNLADSVGVKRARLADLDAEAALHLARYHACLSERKRVASS